MKIALFTKIDLNENNNHIFSIIESFIKNKIEFEIDVDSYDAISNLNNKFISDNTVKNFKKLNSNFDYVISVGGDGTILKSAKEIGELLIPIVGLNKGRLGFLANSKVEIIDDILNKLKKKEFNISERSIIKAEFTILNQK